MPPWWLILGILLFLGSIIYTFSAVGTATSNSDSKAEMSKAITSVAVVNLVLTVILFGIALVYVTTDTTTERNYLMIMTHVAVFLSILSVSVSSLHQLDSAAVFPPGSQSKKECPS
jgi:cytochrome c biogenesis factor